MTSIDLKWVSLMTLVIQNSSLVLVMRYSRTLSNTTYLASTAVVMAEILKLLASFLLYSIESFRLGKVVTLKSLFDDLFGQTSGWKKMTVPAILYFVQNNLQYHAVSMLDAATFQVTYQMKILTTAMFSVLLLRKSLSTNKWISLVLLTLGIALVQLSNSKDSGKEHSNQFLGLIVVALACILSGLAGVWFEKVLKGSKSSIFLRNMQLCIFSILPGLTFGVYIVDREKVLSNGFFGGYNGWTWATITNQALGGLIVAMVVKYADNILKGFATSISIILSCFASMFIFDFELTFLFAVGSSIVLFATHLYGLPDKQIIHALPISKSEEKLMNFSNQQNIQN